LGHPALALAQLREGGEALGVAGVELEGAGEGLVGDREVARRHEAEGVLDEDVGGPRGVRGQGEVGGEARGLGRRGFGRGGRRGGLLGSLGGLGGGGGLDGGGVRGLGRGSFDGGGQRGRGLGLGGAREGLGLEAGPRLRRLAGEVRDGRARGGAAQDAEGDIEQAPAGPARGRGARARLRRRGLLDQVGLRLVLVPRQVGARRQGGARLLGRDGASLRGRRRGGRGRCRGGRRRRDRRGGGAL